MMASETAAVYLPQFTQYLLDLSRTHHVPPGVVGDYEYFMYIDWLYSLSKKVRETFQVFATSVWALNKLRAFPDFFHRHPPRVIVATVFLMATKLDQDEYTGLGELEVFAKTSFQSIRQCEIDVWMRIDYDMTHCNHHVLLNLVCWSTDPDGHRDVLDLASFVLVSSMYCPKALEISPHKLVAGSLCLARHILGDRTGWSVEYERLSGCAATEVLALANKVGSFLAQVITTASKHDFLQWGVYRQYASRPCSPYVFACVDFVKRHFRCGIRT